ncbi:transcriptional antiterminator [Burkholderia sp. Ac-20365]|uniref:transcriptional antiterminator n=1 Tax=Burkholderia sp. Ac-20365 TaxID=2703897 RepID=UPI00197BA879|nr:transcriptional antiterminator [Burkholderia sp. Ac-20365]MBN3762325.1 transcriptional antiterminator [Burkholderia sp. Ac-20365]
MEPANQPCVSPTLLVPNDVFIDDKGTRFRLLRVCGDDAWIINLTDKNAWPRICAYAVLAKSINAKKARIVKTGVSRQTPFCSRATAARRTLAYGTIAPLISNPLILDAVHRGPLVTERAEKTGHSKTTINKYLRLYWTGGQTQDALLFTFTSICNIPRGLTNGRGKRSVRYDTYQLGEADIENIRNSIEKHYFTNATHTLASAYLEMLKEKYSFFDGNGDSFIKPAGERPSMRQYSNVFKRLYPLEERLRRRKGEKDFNRDHNHHLAGALCDAIGAGHVYEIDATIDDVWLVAKDNRMQIIGKPTKYLIYDSYSRLCTGFYVGLESACWESAMQAILSIAESKSELCAKLKVPCDPSDWVAQGVYPSKWLGDCGEMISHNSNRICDGMEGTLSNAPPLSPQTKGIVECGFKSMHVQIASITPGYDPPSNAKRRRGKHYENDASLTVDEYTAVILLAIIEHNRTLMKKYQAHPSVVMRTRPVPIELWNDSIRNQVGNLWRYTEDYLRLKLLPMSTGTVQSEGIAFGDCFYSCPELEKNGWFISAANRGRSDVSVSFDRRLVDAIIVYDPNNPNLAYRCELTPRSAHFKGYSFSEVKFIKTITKQVIADNEQDDLQRRCNFSTKVSEITDPAFSEMKEATQGKSRNARKTHAADARLAEKTERRQAEATIPLNILDSTSSEPGHGSGILPANVVAMPTRKANSTPAPAPIIEIDTPAPSDSDSNATCAEPPVPKSLEERLAMKRQELLNGSDQ